MANVTTTVRARLIQAKVPTIYNLSMPTSGTEYSQALSENTKKIMVKTRDRTAKLRIAFVSGNTNTLWITLEAGAVFFEENLDLEGATIYLQSDKNGQVVEILQWV